MKKKLAETELAEAVIEYLQEQHWEVYQEVQIFSYDAIADIVAVQKNKHTSLVWVIECKTTLSMALMEQAYGWKQYANYISIAIPKARYKNIKGRNFAYKILRNEGIGILHYSSYSTHSIINQYAKPILNRKAMTKYVLDCLTEQHKTFAKAGNPNGHRYTPFQNTKQQIIAYVKKNPGVTMKEIINNISHHYASNSTATSSISTWITEGVIPLIKKRDGRIVRYYAEEEKKK